MQFIRPLPPPKTRKPLKPVAPRLATRLAFLVAGFGIASWAPLVPYAKERLHVNDGELGALLLCIGVGSMFAMVATGPASARYGVKPIIVTGGIIMALVLPILAVAPSSMTLGIALFLFGAALGATDVAMNIHAVEVEQIAARPLMSGFHALFSIGGFAGSGCVTAMLASQWSPWHATLLCGALMLVAMLVCGPRLLDRSGANEGPLFAFPRGIVLVLAGLAAISFLVEGAMLDWGALLVTGAGLLPRARAGLGFILFSVAMTCGRLIGDRLTAHIGDRTTLFAGGVLAIFGFITLLLLTSPVLALSGFISIGLGISNLVPILFRQTAVQKSMPQALALGAVTTCGYLGVLSGPAAIGFMAKAASLSAAFWMLAGLLCLVPVSARMVTKHRNRP